MMPNNKSNTCEEGQDPVSSVGKNKMTQKSLSKENECISLTSNEVSLTSGFTGYNETSSALTMASSFICIYLLVGTLSFHYVFKDLTFIEALYFSVVTSTSCGYGDFYAESNGEKVYLMFYIIVGICGLGIGIGIIGDRLVKYSQKELKEKDVRSQKKLIGMFEEQDTSEKKGHSENTQLNAIVSIFVGIGPYIALIATIALVIGYFEGWDIVTSLYFCVVTTTTVGYGDVTPKTPAMQLLCVLYLPISITVMANFLERVAGSYITRQAEKTEREFLNRSLSLKDIFEMDQDGDGEVDMGEFLSYMLVAMGKIEKDDINELKVLFHKLDADKSGKLDKKDLMLGMKSNVKKSHID